MPAISGGGDGVGENPRADDMNVNPTKMRKQTNMRAASKDETEKLTPHRALSLEQTLEFIRDDECLEVTPSYVRLRKLELSQHIRSRRRRGTVVPAAGSGG